MSFEVAEMWHALSTGNKATRYEYMDRILRMAIPMQIRGMREAKGWTQTELAARLGVSQARVSVLETIGAELPTIRTLQRVAHVFDVGLLVHFTSWSQFIEYAVGVEKDGAPIPPEFDQPFRGGSDAS